MKKRTFIAAVCAATALTSVPFSVSAAEGDYIYGTMEIPYADFYRAELEGSANTIEVDAVTSATASKWSMNEEGKLCEGTFNKPNENGEGGQILGVVYPVAVKKEDLTSFEGSSYNFTKTDEVPSAYKIVTVENGAVSFSAVQDSTPEKLTGQATITANTSWGDYLVNVADKPENMGAVYGAIVRTSNNKSYGFRHLENIWRGEVAWSSGVRKTEPHGNELSYENYADIMGETIKEVTYITKNGYYTADTDLYVPVKFEGSVAVENASAASGKTTVTTEGFPADYAAEYGVNGLDITVSGNTVNFSSAVPGNYTLSVSDKNGKYAGLSASFTLTTDRMPAAYSDRKIVKADGASDEEFANFIKNLSKITVNEKSYSASGKGAVKVIGEDGTIDMEAASRDVKVFEGSEKYSVSVSANGYEKTLDFVIDLTPAVTTAAPSVTTAKPSSATAPSTTARPSSTTAKTNAQKLASSPATGETTSAALPVTAVAAAVAAFLTFKKRNKK